MSLAALPMYDLDGLHAAHDRLWSAIRDALGEGPDTLDRSGDVWRIWRDDDLLLAQTCGLPYRARLHGTVTLVGTPDYGLPGCAPGYYNSVIVVRRDDAARGPADLAGRRLAYNEPLSQSGWAAPQAWMAEHGISTDDLLCTGAHAASARAVQEARADFAALDALTWALLSRNDAQSGLRVVGRTTPTPGLPYITSLRRDPAPIRDAVRGAIAALSEADRAALHLVALTEIPAADYLALPLPDPPAETASPVG